MKKNLFGAVSAALALALAITSFGCESGNDSPIRVVTDADRAALDKATFKYVATPTEYKNTTASTDTSSGSVGSYEWTSYINGTLAYNRNTSVTTKGTVDGTKVGDVIKTKKVTLSLDVNAGTWSALEETTSKEVFEIVDYDATTASYASVKVVKAKEIGTIGSETAFDVSSPSGTSTYVPAAITNGYLATTGTGVYGYADAKAKIDAAITAANGLKKAAVYSADDKTFNDAVDANVKSLKEDLALIDAKWHGATKVVVETTADGKTTTSYLKADGTAAIAPVVATGDAPKAKTGKYVLTSGNYATGSILITADDKITYDDANDIFVDDGYKGKISITYPEAGPQVGGRAGVIGNKTSRTASINGGTLTFTKTLTSNTDSTTKTYAFFKDLASYTKYYETDAASYAATAEAGYVSYNFVLQK